MSEGAREAFTKWNIGQSEPVQNERRGKGSFYKMKHWPGRTGAEWKKGKGKPSQNEILAKANLCRIRKWVRKAFTKWNFGSGEPVHNERRGKGSFCKMKTLAKANLCRMKEGEREAFIKWNFGAGEPVQNERRGKGSCCKMKTWLRRTCAEWENGKRKLSWNETLAKTNLSRMREGPGEAFAKRKLGPGEPVQNERRGQESFHKMKTWIRRACAEWEKRQEKLLENENLAQVNLCRMREEAGEAFAKGKLGSGEPVQNEKMGQRGFHKMKTWLRRPCAEWAKV